MPITLRPIEQLAEKFVKRAQASSPEYAAGVAAPKKDQAAEAIAAAPAYNQGVQEAIARDGFAKGVRKAGTAKWQEKAKTVGAQRYPQGVAGAKADWQNGFAPYAGVLSAVSLPSKGARGAAGNLERVRAVADALHNKRVSGGS